MTSKFFLKKIEKSRGFYKRGNNTWYKVFKNGPSKIYERQPLKDLLSPPLNTLSHIFPYLGAPWFYEMT